MRKLEINFGLKRSHTPSLDMSPFLSFILSSFILSFILSLCISLFYSFFLHLSLLFFLHASHSFILSPTIFLKVPLRQFSGWLSDFDAATNRIEIPGQYIQTGSRSPNVENHAMLGKDCSYIYIFFLFPILNYLISFITVCLTLSLHFFASLYYFCFLY